MAEQIITLGIGPVSSLTPFILTGLDISASIYSKATGTFIPYRERRAFIEFRDKRAFIPYREKRAISGDN
jgi:hypothetical protein